MKKLLFILILSFQSLPIFAQFNQIDLVKIKGIANTDTYEILHGRYLENDTTLTLDDYLIIYYGQAFRDNYKPYKRHNLVLDLKKYMIDSDGNIDYQKVLSFTHKILPEFPFNIDEIYSTYLAYKKLGMLDSSKIWYYKYDKLINTIISSGDGMTYETAFIVTKITDEYSLIRALGLESNMQSLVSNENKYYDSISISENKYGIVTLLFDINLFIGKFR